MIGDFIVSFFNSCIPFFIVSCFIYFNISNNFFCCNSCINFNFKIRVRFLYNIFLIKFFQFRFIFIRICALLDSTNKLNNGNMLEDISKNKERIVGMTDFSLVALTPTTQMDSASTISKLTQPLLFDVFYNSFILKFNTGEILEMNSTESSSTVFSFGTSSSCSSQPNIHIESAELSFFSKIGISSFDDDFLIRFF